MMNVVKSLSELTNIEEIDVSLETKKIKIKYKDENLSKEDIRNIVEQSILSGKAVKLNDLIYK
jgi:copper chaperone CopZ